MTWRNTIADVVHIPGTSKYWLLVGAVASPSQFGVSAVVSFDANDSQSSFELVVPPTPTTWISMKLDCAGRELLLTGGEYCFHEFAGGQLVERPIDTQLRSGELWRIDQDSAMFCGDGGEIFTVSREQLVVETVTPFQLGIGWIHGIPGTLRLAAGAAGCLLQDRGSGWSQVEDVPTLNQFTNIFCENDSSFYMAAGFGSAFRWDGGSKWLSYDIPEDAFAYNLTQYAGEMYLSTLHLKSYRLVGDQAVQVEGSTVANRLRAAGPLLFGLGMDRFEMFDGERWRIREFSFTDRFGKNAEELREQYETY